MTKNQITLGTFALVLLLFMACKKENEFVNPFDDPSLQPPDSSFTEVNLVPGTFPYLHYRIFQPTCANSGCHDGGEFDPDFRKIESSYNTLVFHPVKKQDPDSTHTFRVDPGNLAQSVLYTRLTRDIDGFSGLMPLVPTADWVANQDEYKDAIRDWIEAGAPDIMGNLPNEADQLPKMTGVIGFLPGDSMSMDREPGLGPIQVPVGETTVEIWIAISDFETASPDLGHNKIKVSLSQDDFSGAVEYNLDITSNPLNELDYFGEPAEYYHKFSLDVSNYNSGDLIFMRSYVQDGNPNLTVLPNDGSALHIKEYSALILE